MKDNPNYKKGFVTQSLLDYVEKNPYVSYTALQAYYRLLTGSNSFSHILLHLMRPYRNRPTRRYLVKIKTSIGIRGYHIAHATTLNWIENEW